MQARDIMTTPVLTVEPEHHVSSIAALLLDRGISAVPVVDADGRLLGIVSEGDLIRRVETGTDRQRWRWLDFIRDTDQRAREFVKTHGLHAADVMTRDIITADEDTSARDIAELLEKHGIKRVPIMRDGVVVGIVSRANLLRGLAAAAPGPAPEGGDDAARAALERTLAREIGVSASQIDIVVKDGVARLRGTVRSPAIRQAVHVAAESCPGVTSVEDELTVLPENLRYSMA